MQTVVFQLGKLYTRIGSLGRGLGLVVRAAGNWHAGDNPGSILGRDGLYTLRCIPRTP
jgi:hypothetical protein